jgi:hypothetical protein
MPCKAAFIDAKTPGSHLKDNFSIIGGGVSESKHQRVNLTELHGFCIGAAGQPPHIRILPTLTLRQKYLWCIVARGVSTGTMTASRNDLNPAILFHCQPTCFAGFEKRGRRIRGMIFSIWT